MRRSAILRKSGDRRMDDPAAGALDIARPPRLSLPLPPPSRVEAADAAPRPSGRNGRRRRGGGEESRAAERARSAILKGERARTLASIDGRAVSSKVSECCCYARVCASVCVRVTLGRAP